MYSCCCPLHYFHRMTPQQFTSQHKKQVEVMRISLRSHFAWGFTVIRDILILFFTMTSPNDFRRVCACTTYGDRCDGVTSNGRVVVHHFTLWKQLQQATSALLPVSALLSRIKREVLYQTKKYKTVSFTERAELKLVKWSVSYSCVTTKRESTGYES